MITQKDFTINKKEIAGYFTKIPNALIEELMYYLSFNELRLLLYIYQKSSDFKYNRRRIAQKFGAHKNNIDKIFASLENKNILIKNPNGYDVNLFVSISDMRVEKNVNSIKRIKAYQIWKHEKIASSNTLSEVKNTSLEVNQTSIDSIGEVRNTSEDEVKNTSPLTLTNKPSIGDCSKYISSNNININNTNQDNRKGNKNLNKDNDDFNTLSLIQTDGQVNHIPNYELLNELSLPKSSIKSECTLNSTSISFLMEKDEVLSESYSGLNQMPMELLNTTDGFIAIVALSYKLQSDHYWKEVYQHIEYSKKYLADYLNVCKSALALKFWQNIPNNLADEIIKQSKLKEEVLIKLFFNFSSPKK